MVIGGAILISGSWCRRTSAWPWSLTVALMLIGLGVFHLVRLYRAIRRASCRPTTLLR